MAELDDANSFFEARGNRVWKALPNKDALLLLAGDYILANYNVKSTLSETEQVRFNTAKFQLALEFAKAAPTLKATAPITKSDKTMEGVGETLIEYGDAPVDPYPTITALLAPISVSTAPASIIFGTLSL